MRHFFIFSIFFLFACSEQDQSSEISVPTSELEEDLRIEFQRYRDEILDTRELTIMLREGGYVYDPTLLHSVEMVDEYINSKEQALNIGVYAADLNYMTIFEQNKDNMVYADAIFRLAEELSISEAFDKEYLTELLKNNIPSYKLKSDELNDVFEQAKNEINSSDRAQITALIIAGSWVEGMYLSTSLAQEEWPNEEIAERMWHQCFSYHQVLKMLKIYKDYPPCDVVYRKFLELEPAVTNITETSVRTLKDHLLSYHGIILDLREFIIQN
ncbi:MAG: hypothetical protein HKN39_01325 [Flavobacteriales bacterium]|nr:hypothetical protein [Flavobacteriales bacterium]